jgi:hypothetical protein
MSNEVKRVPVDFDFSSLSPDFLRGLAKIAVFAAEKYGSALQYTNARLEGEKSPANHAISHILHYLNGDPYDRWDGDVRWHLVAAAYNCGMEYWYCAKWGHVRHLLTVDEAPVKTKRRKS